MIYKAKQQCFKTSNIMVTNFDIEKFFNKGKENDVRYTPISRIPPSLVILIREILTNQKR